MKLVLIPMLCILLSIAALVISLEITPPFEEQHFNEVECFNEGHAAQIQIGMTRTEVAEVLGGPPGDYADGKGGPYYIPMGGCKCDSISFPQVGAIGYEEWYGPYGAIG